MTKEPLVHIVKEVEQLFITKQLSPQEMRMVINMIDTDIIVSLVVANKEEHNELQGERKTQD